MRRTSNHAEQPTVTSTLIYRTYQPNSIHEKPVPSNFINENIEIMTVYDHLISDKRYYYQFRYELRAPMKDDNHRLMIILYEARHNCSDPWDFGVGIRILAAMRSFDFSILTICSDRKRYNISLPLTKNDDVVEVCSEECMNEILDRFLDLNEHAASYTWKRLGRPLDMEKTLEENDIPDETQEYISLDIDPDEYIPAIHIYYNDDFVFRIFRSNKLRAFFPLFQYQHKATRIQRIKMQGLTFCPGQYVHHC